MFCVNCVFTCISKQMVIVGAKPQKAFAHSANMLNAAYNSE